MRAELEKKMGKLEDRVNEILGVESKPNAELMQQKEV